MNTRIAFGGLCVAGALVVAGQLQEVRALADRADRAEAHRAGGPAGGVAGAAVADIAVCAVPGSATWPRVDDTHAFSIATTAWNPGEVPLLWEFETVNHPVIAQNMYRLKDGRIEMIGMSWLKHGFCAIHQFECGNCQFVSGCVQFLNPGCSDPYGEFLNGNQAGMGPRSEVNAATSGFSYPWTLGWQTVGNDVYKRLQVNDADLDPARNAGTLYYAEAHYVHPQEGASEQRHNNAGHRRFNVSPSGNTYTLSPADSTVPLPAIYAWKDVDADVVIESVDVPGEPVDGRFHLAYRVTDHGDGTWRYEYALHNMNSHRSARAFAVPLPSGVNVTSTFHRDVKYHSGEVYGDEPWTLEIGGPQQSISWTGVSFDVDPNANALRWSTMFNFGFVADAPPVEGEVTIELFRPGTPGAVTVAALVPEGDGATPCKGDLTGSGSVGVADLLVLLSCWGPVKVGGECEAADLSGDGSVGVADLLELLANWGPCD